MLHHDDTILNTSLLDECNDKCLLIVCEMVSDV